MSRPDLIDQLRTARPLAPEEVRELVRQIAAQATPAKKKRRWWPRITWGRALVFAVPLAAIAVGAAILVPSGQKPVSNQAAAGLPPERPFGPPRKAAHVPAAVSSGSSASSSFAPTTPTPNPNRVQQISTSLELRVANSKDVSAGAQQAVRIAQALGGYPSSLNVDAAGHTGYANLVLRIPKQRLRAAVARLSALGTVIGENVSIHDLQNQVDATARKIARLEARLKAWQEQFQTSETQQHIADLTDQIGKLRRGRAATIHTASYATLSLGLSTRPAVVVVHHPHHNGPLHNLGVAFRWLGIGALYTVALAAPFILLGGLIWLVARTVRRHRENALLSSS
jgi:hypothetical protein